MVQSATKSMLIVYFNVEGVVHREYVPPSSTIKSDFYYDIDLRRKKKKNSVAHRQLAIAS